MKSKITILILALAAFCGLAAAQQTTYGFNLFHGPFTSGGNVPPIQYLGPYFELPQVTAGAPGYAQWTNGTVYPDGHSAQGVQVAASTSSSGVALDASENSCVYPAFTTCDIIYANSSGTVAKTTSIATAKGSGNTVLAYIETDASAVPTKITYPYQITAALPPYNLATDMTGTLPVANGGTGETAYGGWSIIAGACTGTVGSAETESPFLLGAVQTACSGATTSTAGMVMPSAGTLQDLEVASSAAVVGGTGKDVATILDNGTATALTCTIAASAKTCHDTTHTAAVAQGDIITATFVTATTDTAANLSISVEKH